MSSPISRRNFLARAAVIVAALPPAGRGHHERYASFLLRLGVIDLAATGTDQRGMGLILGVEEATRAASMFGGAVELASISDASFRTRGLSAVIGDDNTARCIALSSQASEAGVPFLNVACSSDALRGESCRGTLYHIAPSEAMNRDAISAVRSRGSVAAWHPSLERFGADTLNRRFRSRFNRQMTSQAWTAWMAVKVLWESSLRVRSGEAGKLIEYLNRDPTQFDGHKGAPLSFRSWDRQLRQPLYVVSDSHVVEVPATAKPDETVRDALDQLGTRASESQCQLTS
ncbi:MAG TPA: twin-arginine translocation signal domain-containing protein [Gemmatimonadaceae bacterium]|nr:twin-arginine translocation signal domain-containing protein [Gemmatimonadaceae bacterium]